MVYYLATRLDAWFIGFTKLLSLDYQEDVWPLDCQYFLFLASLTFLFCESIFNHHCLALLLGAIDTKYFLYQYSEADCSIKGQIYEHLDTLFYLFLNIYGVKSLRAWLSLTEKLT